MKQILNICVISNLTLNSETVTSMNQYTYSLFTPGWALKCIYVSGEWQATYQMAHLNVFCFSSLSWYLAESGYIPVSL